MSKTRHQDESVLVRTYGLTFSRNSIVPPASEAWDQLVYATRGVLTVRTNVGTWVVPPYRALWLPANTPCTLEVLGQTALRMLYLKRRPDLAALSSFDRDRCAVVGVSPLLRELILRTIHIGVLQAEEPCHQRLTGLIHDELLAVDTMPLQLPYPTNEQALAFATRLETLVGNPFDMDISVLVSGASRRTLERVFRRETGMSLGQWVRRRKLLEGLRLMAEGATVSDVAFRLGYNGPSAFIAMFKRELGDTPGEYLKA